MQGTRSGEGAGPGTLVLEPGHTGAPAGSLSHALGPRPGFCEVGLATACPVGTEGGEEGCPDLGGVLKAESVQARLAARSVART